MSQRIMRLSLLVSGVALIASCGGPTSPDGSPPPALLFAAVGDGDSAAVATVLPESLVVSVTDSQLRPLANIAVTWSVAQGNGYVTPTSSTTDTSGKARASFTLGTVAGNNVVNASVSGGALSRSFRIVGVPGPLARVTALNHSVQFCGVDTGHVTATAADQYGNAVPGAVTWASRNSQIATVDANGAVTLVSVQDSTYMIASSGAAAPDSVQVKGAVPLILTAAQVDTTLSSNSLCIGSNQAGSEFVLAAFLSSTTPGTSASLVVTGAGMGTIGSGANRADRVASPGAASAQTQVSVLAQSGLRPNVAFETALRSREREEMPRYVPAARAWYQQMQRERLMQRSADVVSSQYTNTSGGVPVYDQIPASAHVGDLVHLNTNANSYCSDPIMATARVAAISNTAIVVADTTNPSGGFTDAEYASFATAMDTLVMPVDTTAFGSPSDIDHNGRVVIFFTKAVNELTTDPSQGVVLGFYYARDLLPATSSQGNCPGSNQAEMFYLVVPDVNGTINGGNTFTKSKQKVANSVVGTIAHEFQHLINASRRMYIINSPVTDEVTWLNEGLSHIAEELTFYRASGLGPRQNIGITALADEGPAEAFNLYMWGNQGRYQALLPIVESHGPIGEYDNDDDLSTRAATWSFLRFVADHRPTDSTFFYRLVNSQTSGLANLQAVIGSDPIPLMRRWSLSVYVNGTVAGIDPAFSQLSWNWPEIFTLTNETAKYPSAHLLSNGVANGVTLMADAGAYFPFAVSNGSSASINITGASGAALSPSIKLTLVRTH